MKIAVNKCYGGFSLSYAGVMEYANNKGIKLYAFIEERDDKGNINVNKFIPYNPEKDGLPLIIHYSTKPLKNGKYDDKSYFSDSAIERDDPELIKTVEKLGDKANGRCAKLEITEIPDGVQWEIEEYDGQEWVSEKHRTW